MAASHAADDRSTLGRELGSGGLRRIVVATDRDLERKAAIKLAREDLPPKMAERFARETRLTAWLEHPNVVPSLVGP